MEARPEINVAEASDLDALTRILAAAFAGDPCMNWVFPDTRLYQRYFRILAERLYLRHQQVFMDSGERATAMWLPPGIEHKVPVSLSLFSLIVRTVTHSGLSILRRLKQAEDNMARHHPTEQHYYLHALGVRPDCQGQGLGSALLNKVIRNCDQNEVPAYLENSSPRNVPFYEHHGFRVIEEHPIGEGGPPMFCMWREPQRMASVGNAT